MRRSKKKDPGSSLAPRGDRAQAGSWRARMANAEAQAEALEYVKSQLEHAIKNDNATTGESVKEIDWDTMC